MPYLYKELEMTEPGRLQADHSNMQYDPNPPIMLLILESAFMDSKQIEIGLWVQ